MTLHVKLGLPNAVIFVNDAKNANLMNVVMQKRKTGYLVTMPHEFLPPVEILLLLDFEKKFHFEILVDLH